MVRERVVWAVLGGLAFTQHETSPVCEGCATIAEIAAERYHRTCPGCGHRLAIAMQQYVSACSDACRQRALRKKKQDRAAHAARPATSCSVPQEKMLSSAPAVAANGRIVFESGGRSKCSTLIGWCYATLQQRPCSNCYEMLQSATRYRGYLLPLPLRHIPKAKPFSSRPPSGMATGAGPRNIGSSPEPKNSTRQAWVFGGAAESPSDAAQMAPGQLRWRGHPRPSSRRICPSPMRSGRCWSRMRIMRLISSGCLCRPPVEPTRILYPIGREARAA
jgi:hypothetical protein